LPGWSRFCRSSSTPLDEHVFDPLSIAELASNELEFAVRPGACLTEAEPSGECGPWSRVGAAASLKGSSLWLVWRGAPGRAPPRGGNGSGLGAHDSDDAAEDGGLLVVAGWHVGRIARAQADVAAALLVRPHCRHAIDFHRD